MIGRKIDDVELQNKIKNEYQNYQNCNDNFKIVLNENCANQPTRNEASIIIKTISKKSMVWSCSITRYNNPELIYYSG